MKNTKKARIIVGLGFGDEGKGTMTDFLCRHGNADLVVRYNGGSQAAHNVVTDEGLHHTFSQFGSGTFIPFVKTLISRYMLWDPIALAHETSCLSPKLKHFALDRHFIDERAPVITPFHVATNQAREWMRGGKKHGSCGKGIGETMFDIVNHPDEVIKAIDLTNAGKLKAMLEVISERKRNELAELGLDFGEKLPRTIALSLNIFSPEKLDQLVDAYRSMAKHYQFLNEKKVADLVQSSKPVFEGAQGVLLDEWQGFHPYTTWSRIVTENARSLLRECCFDGEVETVGITRSYTTRHGSGPFPTEDVGMYGVSLKEHNTLNDWQGGFRSGALDLVLLKYAAECTRAHGGLDSIAVTHVDILQHRKVLPYVDQYLHDGLPFGRLIPNYKRDLDYQSKLTTMLENVTIPEIKSVSTEDQLYRLIQESTGSKVKYTSHGACARDKKVIG